MIGATWMEAGTDSVFPDAGWRPLSVEQHALMDTQEIQVTVQCPNAAVRGRITREAIHRASGDLRVYFKAQLREQLGSFIEEASRTAREDRDW